MELPSASHTSVAADELAVLFERLRRPLHRYLLCSGFVGSDAEEVVQETFLRLQQHLAKNGDRTNLQGWIFQVARNLARNQFRSAERRQTEALDEIHTNAIRDPRRTPEDESLRRERYRKLQAALSRLSPGQRECLLLRAGGLPYREIAKVLGTGISNVAELVERATARLNKELK